MRKMALVAAMMAGMSGVALAAPAFGMQTQVAPATQAEVRRAKQQRRSRPTRRPRQKSAADVLLINLAEAKRRRKAAKLQRDWATYHRTPLAA